MPLKTRSSGRPGGFPETMKGGKGGKGGIEVKKQATPRVAVAVCIRQVCSTSTMLTRALLSSRTPSALGRPKVREMAPKRSCQQPTGCRC